MPKISHHHSLADKRKLRVRSKLVGTSQRPRITIFRSNKYTYIQAIDDTSGKTLAAMTTKKADKGTKINQAITAAQVVAEQLTKQNVHAVIIDRGQYKYHGRIKAVADAMRTAKLEV